VVVWSTGGGSNAEHNVLTSVTQKKQMWKKDAKNLEIKIIPFIAVSL